MMNITNNQPIIIGIDHGYGNIKTSHYCFKTGVTAYDKEPTFKSNMLIYKDRYYIIGEEHKECVQDKNADDDYYILTLAAIAKELKHRNSTTAKVLIAAGLPLYWVSEQKDSFRQYLLQNESVSFTFNDVNYYVELTDAYIFPQGFSAVADKLQNFGGVNMLADIGNGTMNIMYINDKRPISSKCFTEKYGTFQCMLEVRNRLLQLGVSVNDSVIEKVIRTGTADIDGKYLNAIKETATEYVKGIFRKLREHEYDDRLMRLYVVGGGGCMIKHFGEYNPDRVIINSNICATAQGYEYLAEIKLRRNGGAV